MKMRSKKIVLIGLTLVISAIFFVSFNNFVLAQDAVPQVDTFGLADTGSSIGLSGGSIILTITKIIRAALGLLGVIAIGIILYGGFIYMTAGGSEEKVTQAKKILINGTIGLAIILSAFSISYFVLSKLSQATGSGSVPCVGNDCDSKDDKKNAFKIIAGATCPEADEAFVLKSITPNQTGVDGNNLVARAVFSKAVITKLSDILEVKEDNNIQKTDDFTYSFVPDSDNRVVEAIFNKSACLDKTLNCFAVDKTYNLKVKEGVVAEGGEVLKNNEVSLKCPDLGLDSIFKNGATFKVNKLANDDKDPLLSIDIFDTNNKKVADDNQKDSKLSAGKTYYIDISTSDNFGIGYTHIEMKNAVANIINNFDGPAKSSDATFAHTYAFALPKEAKTGDKYSIEITSQDIDHKSLKKSLNFSVVNDLDGKKGSFCISNADCNVGFACEFNACVSVPVITNIDLSNGAPGNWVTVAGINFGDKVGKVQFGADKNENKKIDNDEWVDTKIVECVGSKSWSSNYVVVEVPKIDGIKESPIKLIREDGKFDVSNDSQGPLAGGFGEKDAKGQFVINEIKRPGLCKVLNEKGTSSQAKSLEKIKAIGTGFGKELGKLDFGGLPAKVTENDWIDSQILSFVPENMNPSDEIGVFVTAKSNEKSNGVLFEVLDPDASITKPKIQSFDPAQTTPHSFITVIGTGFGDFGNIYLTILKENDCSNDNQCIKILTPDVCLGGWNNTQIIAQLPPVGKVDIGTKYYIAVKNGKSGEYGVSSEPVLITKGDPTPGLCDISPAIGPAPLPEDKLLTLFGDNLKDSIVYFYKKGTDIKTVVSWFSSAQFLDKDQPKTEKNKVYTKLPLENGASMITGPIRVSVKGVLSNPINYEVQDCTLFPDSKPGNDYQCCTAEGHEKGLWKKDNSVCEGEVREAGYVWRFTTGKFPDIPYVIEEISCTDKEKKPNTSPSPWIQQPSGKSECLNVSAHVDFSTNMDQDTLTPDNIKLYDCGVAKEPDCSDDKKKLVEWGKDKFTKGVTYFTAEPSNLSPTTWYRVELSNKITSKKITTVAGKSETQKEPLLMSRPCNNGTAYCYTFKTGIEGCSITGAGILPKEHVTEYVGVVQDTTFGIDENVDDPAHPLDFRVWGTTDNSCALINVDGLGWAWNPPNKNSGLQLDPFVEMYKKIPDTKAHAIAKKHNDKGVKITASIKANPDKNIKKDISAEATLFVDLLDPAVNNFQPACLESCINPQIYATFNRQMDTTTYSSGFSMYTCKDAVCLEKEKKLFADANVDMNGSDKLTLSIKLNSNLVPNTYYQVSLDEKILAYSGAKDIKGKELIPKTWTFKTQNDPNPCTVGSLVAEPGKYTAKQIGSKKIYSAIPYTLSNNCSPQGQALNKWEFEYLWSTPEDDGGQKKIADVTHFKKTSLDKLNKACGPGCLPNGADVKRDALKAEKGMCGNNQIDIGEDCDFTMQGEIAGTTCTYSCLRPGNTDSNTCGNGKVEKELGEECEPLDDKGVKVQDHEYCTNSCTWKGSTPFEEGKTKSNCGDGAVTAGEDCDPGKDIDGNVIKNNKYCSSQCTNIGRPLASSWCETQVQAPKECASALSVCGNIGSQKVIDNAFLENDEECEIIYDINDKKYGLAIRGVEGLLLKNDTSAPLEKYCGNSCRLIKGCELNKEVPGNVKDVIGGFYCAKGSEGCTDSCLIAGSSINYSVPSLCGDSIKGIGEYLACESPKDNVAQHDGPVQVVTAKGEKDTKDGKQETKIKITLASDLGISVEGDYALQCGFTESKIVVPNEAFNDCPNSGQGVSNINSCCYPRPIRSLEYPEDGAGTGNQKGVCRNTAIFVSFNKEIKVDSAEGSVLLVKGYNDEKYTCQEDKAEKDITGVVQQLLVYNIIPAHTNWFEKIWFNLKNIIASTFGADLQATTFGNYLQNTEKIKVWCALPNNLDIEVFSQKDSLGEVSTSTVFANINELLDPGAIYGVLLKSGPDGLKDVKEVSIANPDSKKIRDDFWVFKTKSVTDTDNGVCKIDKVEIIPKSQLFDKPNQLKDFSATAYGKGNTQLVKTPAYDWVWDWQPQNNPVFDIPGIQGDTNKSKLAIASKNVQGSLSGATSVVVTKDISVTNNQIGKSFTAISDLTADFCERPWPSYEKGGSWSPYKDEKFNFSFKYCADSGQSGETGDDLPYIKLVVPGGNKCSVTGDSCISDKDCSLAGVWPSSYTLDLDFEVGGKSFYLFKEIKDFNGVCFNVVVDPKGTECKDSYSCTDSLYPNCGYKEKKCVRYEFPQKPLGTNGNICNDPVYATALKQSTLIDSAVKKQNCVESLQFKKEAGIPDEEGLLQKLFFFNDKNNDAIGLRIFTNPLRLSSANWFQSKFPGSAVPQSISIAGYDGVSDGSNYYINAMNIIKSGPGIASYNNIYIFSVNPDAQNTTRKVFEDILKSLSFNINMSDHGYCVSKDIKNTEVDFMKEITEGKKYPFTSKSCVNDFDCVDPLGKALDGTNGVCSNGKTKFQRDWTRFGQVQGIQQLLKNYVEQPLITKYPELKAGSFIPGVALSRWSAWGGLGQTLGGSLATDPINEWSQCEGANQQTCWNETEAKLVCPTKSSVYEYNFIDDKTATGTYSLHVPFEYFQNKASIQKEFGKEFNIDTSLISLTPYCVPDTKYSPFGGGTCGDGFIQPDEQCDPPGLSQIDKENKCNPKPGETSVATCQKDCKWKYECTKVGACGNGIIEGNEVCDDGVLNGTYGHCSDGKTGFNSKPFYPACMGPFIGYCGNGFLDQEEVCDASHAGGNKWKPWALKKELSCGPTCQGTGEYCGDGILQEKVNPVVYKVNGLDIPKYEIGEECDDGNVLAGDGCSNVCTKENKACLDAKPQFLYLDNKEPYTSRFYITRLSDAEFKNVEKNIYKGGSPIFYPSQEHIAECFVSTGNSICYSATKSACQSVQRHKKKINDDKSVTTEYSKIDCNQNLKPYFDDENGKIPDSRLEVDCAGQYNPPKKVEPVPSIEKGCGNAKTETDDPYNEACDDGKNNGVACIPGYGSSCTYCAQDCKKILTVDPTEFCGNNIIEGKNNEKCDFKGALDNQTEVFGFVKKDDKIIIETLKCADKGKYSCLAQCTKPYADCVVCGIAEKKANPKLALINPMISKHLSSLYKKFGQGDPYNRVFLYRKNPPKSLAPAFISDKVTKFGLGGKDFDLVGNSSNDLGDPFSLRGDQFINVPSKKGIEANLQCSGEYSLFFNVDHFIDPIIPPVNVPSPIYNERVSTAIDAGVKGDIFEYPIAGEQVEVFSEYIYSPAVPTSTFRVVIDWGQTEFAKDLKFVGGVYSESFEGGSKYKNAGDALTLCAEMELKGVGASLEDQKTSINKYWWPTNDCTRMEGVYVHPIIDGQENHLQSFTIDASKMKVGEPYAFYVKTISDGKVDQDGKLIGGPIGYYSEFANPKVLVYDYHIGQDPTYSVYKPRHEFSLQSSAEKAGSLGVNKGARFWYVFNLVKAQDGTISVQPVEKIKTDLNFLEDEYQKSYNPAKKLPVQNGNGDGDNKQADEIIKNTQLVDKDEGIASIFSADGIGPSVMNPDDAMVLFRFNKVFNSYWDIRGNLIREESELKAKDCDDKLSPLECYKILVNNPPFVSQAGVVDIKEDGQEVQKYQKYSFFDLQENVTYRYVITFIDVEPYDEYKYISEFIESSNTTKIDFYTGKANIEDGNKFLSNLLVTLDKNTTFGNKPAKWYVFKVIRNENVITFTKVNKFLPEEIKPVDYKTYDQNNSRNNNSR